MPKLSTRWRMSSGKNLKLKKFLVTQLKPTTKSPNGEKVKTEITAFDSRHQVAFDVEN